MVRSPHLHDVVRAFCLAAFAHLTLEQERGARLDFALEEHATPGRPALYEHRLLVRSFVEARADRLEQLADARFALDELCREPAAAIFAPAHGLESFGERALFRAILLPLAIRTAEACGGFDWEDGAFEQVYAELEQSLFGASRSYGAVAPLVGLSVRGPVELARGIRIRPSSLEELSSGWPEARGLIPTGFGLEPERANVLELERDLPGGENAPPDAAADFADAVTALRLATAAPAAAGPVVLERLDWLPCGIRRVLGIAGSEPGGEPTRLDPWRAGLARDLLARLGRTEADPELGEALERWELSLFEDEPLRSDRLRDSLTALLGGADGTWAAALRASMLLGDASLDRTAVSEGLRDLARAGRTSDGTADALRRAIVETMLHDDRRRLIATLDDALLGLRTRPPGYFAARAVAS
jgi:hypothetical protein